MRGFLALFNTAGTSTGAGIKEIIFQQPPRYLLTNGLNKVNDAKNLSALLTWMKSDRIVRADWRGRWRGGVRAGFLPRRTGGEDTLGDKV